MSPERRSRPDEDYVQAVMQRFVRDFPDVVLIGGWATYIRTRIAKSHDIDIIVDHATLAKLGAKFQLSASHHISGRKFELKVEGVGVDVYPVYQSKLGQRLDQPHRENRSHEGPYYRGSVRGQNGRSARPTRHHTRRERSARNVGAPELQRRRRLQSRGWNPASRRLGGHASIGAAQPDLLSPRGDGRSQQARSGYSQAETSSCP